MGAQELMMHSKTLVRSLWQKQLVSRDKQKHQKVLDPVSTVQKKQPLLSSQTNLSQISPRHWVVLSHGTILMAGLAPTNLLNSSALLPRKWRLVNDVILSSTQQHQDLVFTSPQSITRRVTHQQPALWISLVAKLILWVLQTVQEVMLAT
jgi:hypothetical protein